MTLENNLLSAGLGSAFVAVANQLTTQEAVGAAVGLVAASALAAGAKAARAEGASGVLASDALKPAGVMAGGALAAFTSIVGPMALQDDAIISMSNVSAPEVHSIVVQGQGTKSELPLGMVHNHDGTKTPLYKM